MTITVAELIRQLQQVDRGLPVVTYKDGWASEVDEVFERVMHRIPRLGILEDEPRIGITSPERVAVLL